MSRAARLALALKSLGWLLLGAWLVLFALSLTHETQLMGRDGQPATLLFPRFALRGHVWFPAWQFHSMDFLHVFGGVQTEARGGDAYAAMVGDPMSSKFSWPPLTLSLYTWCRFLPFVPIHVTGWARPVLFLAPAAVAMQTLILGLIAVLGGRAAYRQRQRLGLGHLPWPLLCGLFVWSTPVLFAVERGNLDLLVLLTVILACLCLRPRSLVGDLAAGGLLAVGAWIKLYPALLVLVILALRRWRVLAAYVAVGVLVPLTQPHAIRSWLLTNGILGAIGVGPGVGIGAAQEPVLVYSHPVFNLWSASWASTPLAALGRVPGRLVALAIVGPAILFVCAKIARSVRREALVLPLMLWVLALATFVPNVSFDYNLAPLPLAILCLVDKDDWRVLAAFALLLPWWQPFDLRTGPVSAACWDVFLNLGKAVAAVAVGALLVQRAAAPPPLPPPA